MTVDANSIFNLALNRSGFFSGRNVGTKNIFLASEIESLGEQSRGGLHGIPEQDLVIVYKSHPLVTFSGEALRKPFLRYDFQNEWNNRGYGRVSTSEDRIFSCCQAYFLKSDCSVIAEVYNLRTGEKITDYAALFENGEQTTLWFNRPVGPVDGYDWVIVENFLSLYGRDNDQVPMISEVPHGYSGAVTMRIDCDEAVSSGRQLFELYRKHEMPFSMAIKTQQDLGLDDIQLMKDVIAAKGSIVGHSHTHAPNWGGSAESAQWEVQECHRVLANLGVAGINYDYVVSPFHQNPRSSIEGLQKAGIKGFVGGIICNDPEYLMARSGKVPGVPGIISHSQQCMFHGETYHEAQNSIEGYKSALKQALETRTFFGFLDHPFSNYWYGWKDEEERLRAHEEFLFHLGTIPSLWRANLVDTLRFLEMKSRVRVEAHGGVFHVSLPYDERFLGLPAVSVRFGSKEYELKMGDQVVIS